MRTRVRAVSILGAATSWTGHSLKIRIGGRSLARRLLKGELRVPQECFRKRDWARDRESSAACSMSLSASPAVTHRSNTTPHGHATVSRKPFKAGSVASPVSVPCGRVGRDELLEVVNGERASTKTVHPFLRSSPIQCFAPPLRCWWIARPFRMRSGAGRPTPRRTS